MVSTTVVAGPAGVHEEALPENLGGSGCFSATSIQNSRYGCALCHNRCVPEECANEGPALLSSTPVACSELDEGVPC